MKKGFTVVELITSFALATMFAVVLFQIVLVLKDLYVNSGSKTALLNKQNIITHEINKVLQDKEIKNVESCGTYCVKFTYTDSTYDELLVDRNASTIQFGEYKTNIDSNSQFGSASIETKKIDDGKVLSLVKIKLYTGRTHQIRVQFASRGTPLYGDGKYGGKDNGKILGLWSNSIILNIGGNQIKISDNPPDLFPWKCFATLDLE